MEKNRAPPPSHQKNENQNVSKPAEQLDLTIQNAERLESLKIEAIQKSEENMAPLPTLPQQHQEILIQKTAEQLEGIIDAQNQDEFGLPCINDVPNTALAASSEVIAEDIKQNSNDNQSFAIDMGNTDLIQYSRQSTLKRSKENEIIQISSDELTNPIVGTEAPEVLNISGRKGKDMKIISVKSM